jgi:RsiW-degrading membrane proteinase PrsW (M82 family)
MSIATRALVPFLLVFFIVTLIIGIAWTPLQNAGMDNLVLLGANTLFLLMCILVYFIQKKALSNPNPNVFIRSVMSGMMIKMFSCVIAVLIYTVGSGTAFNKRSVFVSLLLYLVYLAVEVIAVSRLNKKRNG